MEERYGEGNASTGSTKGEMYGQANLRTLDTKNEVPPPREVERRNDTQETHHSRSHRAHNRQTQIKHLICQSLYSTSLSAVQL